MTRVLVYCAGEVEGSENVVFHDQRPSCVELDAGENVFCYAGFTIWRRGSNSRARLLSLVEEQRCHRAVLVGGIDLTL